MVSSKGGDGPPSCTPLPLSPPKASSPFLYLGTLSHGGQPVKAFVSGPQSGPATALQKQLTMGIFHLLPSHLKIASFISFFSDLLLLLTLGVSNSTLRKNLEALDPHCIVPLGFTESIPYFTYSVPFRKMNQRSLPVNHSFHFSGPLYRLTLRLGTGVSSEKLIPQSHPVWVKHSKPQASTPFPGQHSGVVVRSGDQRKST